MLDGVSEIDWSALEHAYGSAGEVPRWLAAMTDPETSADALGEIDAAVYHQGGAAYSAGAAVLPFLIRFALDQTVPHRPDILDLISCFAALHHEMNEPWRSRPTAVTCRAALLTAFDSLLELLEGPDPAIRRGAVKILVELTERADELADQLMRRVPGEANPDVAAYPDAVPKRTVIVRSLRREPEVFRMGSTHYRDDFYMLDQDPGIADVCLPLTAFADELVPAIRWRLRNDPGTPTAYQLTQVLAAYGPAAAAAVPELTALLDTPHPVMACTVLAALGPAAEAARTRLTHLATSAGPDGVTAAWTLFRITGDPEPVLTRDDVLDAQGVTAATARMLGDLGPTGMRYLPAIERQLVEKPNLWPTWDGVELGFAHYRITGDPALCLTVFDAALGPLRHNRQLPVSRQALRYLAALGPAAAEFAHLLRRAAEQDERLLYSGGWRGIAEDDEARDLANHALAAILP